MPPFPPLDAPPLRLEPVSVAHAEEMHWVLSDASIYEFLDEEGPPTLDWLREAYARREVGRSPDGSEQWFNWMIRGPEGRLIGYVQATIESPEVCWIAYVVTAKGRGQGHATRAVAAMIDYLVRSHGVVRLHASVERAHTRSIALLVRAGFELAPPGTEQGKGLSANEALYLRTATSAADSRPRPAHVWCDQPAPILYPRTDGRIHLMEPIPVPRWMDIPGGPLVERALAEWLQALDLEQVSYSPAWLFDPVSKQDIHSHVRVHVGRSFDIGRLADESMDGLWMMLMDGRDCFVSPALKALLQGSPFRYLRFSEGLEGHAAAP